MEVQVKFKVEVEVNNEVKVKIGMIYKNALSAIDRGVRSTVVRTCSHIWIAGNSSSHLKMM